jgi:hypothetical protein
MLYPALRIPVKPIKSKIENPGFCGAAVYIDAEVTARKPAQKNRMKECAK